MLEQCKIVPTMHFHYKIRTETNKKKDRTKTESWELMFSFGNIPQNEHPKNAKIVNFITSNRNQHK